MGVYPSTLATLSPRIWVFKVAKRHLLTPDYTMNCEEFLTFLTCIEEILNSRQICYQNNKTAWIMPRYFLDGENFFITPGPESSGPIKLTNRYCEMDKRI